MTTPTENPTTLYNGPVATAELSFGGRALKLVRPAEPDRLLDHPAVVDRNRRDDYMPYWAYLWPGAYLLAEAVAAERWVKGTPALEIGCGLGLAGLVGATRGLNVCFTDYDDAPLEFVARSARANGLDPSRYATRLLDWREPSAEKFSVILAADVLYERRLVPLVVDVLDAMLAPGGVALVAGPYRVADEGFPAQAGAAGLVCESRPVETQTLELGRVCGTLHRVTRG
jgi:predicted nicotinamide N-methyase